MKLNIHCITYNHEKFIAAALDGFLAQKTNFDFRIVVADDCSTDGTADILKIYAQKYPTKFTLILNDRNIGMMANYIKVFDACVAQYIAFCEGDDYWTDSLKLQKQIDFLDANPDFIQVFHNTMVMSTDASRQPYLFSAPGQGEHCETKNLLESGSIIPTCTNVFRRFALEKIPAWVLPLGMADWPVNMLLSQKGKVKYLNDVMGVYRVHADGVWSATTAVNKCIMLLDAYKAYLKNLELTQTEIKICKRMIAKCTGDVYNTFLSLHQKGKAASFLLKYIASQPLYIFNIRFLKNIKHFVTHK